MESYTLPSLVATIRELARTKQFTICRLPNAIDEADQLLQVVSDEVVYNHLQSLHPFQFVRGDEQQEMYVFSTLWHKYRACIVVDLSSRTVLSFYRENSLQTQANPIGAKLNVIPETSLIMEKSEWKVHIAVGCRIVTIPIRVAPYASCINITEQQLHDAITSEESHIFTQYLDLVRNMGAQFNIFSLKVEPTHNPDENKECSNLACAVGLGVSLYSKFGLMSKVLDATIDILLWAPPSEITDTILASLPSPPPYQIDESILRMIGEGRTGQHNFNSTNYTD